MPRLLDQRPFTECQKLARLGDGNGVLELEPGGDEAAGLDVEVGVVARDADADRRALGACEVALAHDATPLRARAPRVVQQQELAFDLAGHAPGESARRPS
jgi:hypothetical protein